MSKSIKSILSGVETDVFDAMTTVRPYRPAQSRKKVLEIIANDSGKHFDPDLVPTFIEVMNKQYHDTRPKGY